MNSPENLQVECKNETDPVERSARGDRAVLAAPPLEILQSVVEHSLQLVVVLDSEWTIVWANPTFLTSFPAGKQGSSFADLLNDASARSLDLVRGASSRFDLELHHLTSGGVQIVSYRFVSHDSGLILALGSDRSGEMEVVAQMAVLIEELEREVNERIRLGEKLEELATTDGLTGVLNRRRFDEILAEEWQRWTRYGTAFGLILIDIDHFKAINDTHGHSMGDEVLRRMGKTLRDVVRTEDTVARYGGEEFAIIAIGAGLESAVGLASRLRDGIRETPMPDPVGAITVSLGIASSGAGVESAAEVINQADEALYRAKKNGRDRIEIFEPTQSSKGD